MKEFSFSDLSRMVGQIVDTAMLEPIALIKRGRRKLVILPAEEYDRLLAAAGEGTVETQPAVTADSDGSGSSRLSGLRRLSESEEA